jgi:hypothetical protein
MFCYACYFNESPPPEPADGYLSALSDVTLRGMAATADALCEKHKHALARHTAAQAEVLLRLKSAQCKR